jgi:hypothetical protein
VPTKYELACALQSATKLGPNFQQREHFTQPTFSAFAAQRSMAGVKASKN